MSGDGIKFGIKGNRLLGDERVSELGKPTGPKPQRLLKKSPLLSLLENASDEIFV